MKKKLAIAFFFSGAAALVYQVLWARMLGLVFGNTTYAVSTVLAAFMGGMALGSYFLGRYAEKPGFRPVKTLAFIEAGIGAYCAVSPLLFAAAAKLYILAQQGEISLPAVTLLRFLLSSAILLLPTFLMGGTLPVMTRALKTLLPEGELPRAIGLFYGVNTAGAVFGVIFASFFAIALLGVSATLAIAVGVNLAVAALLYRLGANEKAADSSPEGTPAPAPDLKLARTALAAAAIAGFTSMICEVIWTRSLSMVIGMSVYSFAVMLAAFLSGIAAGSFFFTKYLEERVKAEGKEGFLAIGVMLGAAGVLVLSTIPVFNHLPLLFLRLFKLLDGTFYGLLVIQTLIAFFIMAVPAAAFGLMFPMLIKIYSRAGAAAEKTSSSVGRVYAFNTAGCIAGSLLAGFALVSLLGLEGSIRAAGIFAVASALAALFLAKGALRLSLPAAGFLLFAAAPHLLAVGAWDRAVMNSGVYQYAPDIIAGAAANEVSLKEAFSRAVSGEELYHKAGANVSVAVMRDKASGILSLSIDGKVDASTDMSLDMQTQLLSGHLPMLLHPGAKKVLVIGLASGVTLGAVGAYPAEEIDCVEIEPAMTEAAGFFGTWNNGILKDKRVKLIHGDGRNYLQASKKKYDVIISVPSNPWIPGSSALFTREFFESARESLAPGGVFCQWMQAYEVRLYEVRSVAAAAAGVFPGLSLWNPVGGDLLMVSGPDKFSIDYPGFAARFSPRAGLLEGIGIKEPLDLLSRFITAGAGLEAFIAGAPANTDDRPLLEFTAPRYLYSGKASGANQTELVRIADTVSDRLENFSENRKLANTYMERNLPGQAEKEIKGLLAGKGSAGDYDLLARALMKQGRSEEAEAGFFRALELKPGATGPMLNLSQLYLEGGELPKALALAQKAITNGGGAPAHNQAGLVLLRQGDIKGAVSHFGAARRAKPDYVQAYINEAVANLDYWDMPPAAYMLLDTALRYAPRSGLVHYHLGRSFHRMGIEDQAALSFKQALELDPGLEPLLRRELRMGAKG